MIARKFVAILVGPTAVGKTAISLPLAKKLNAEIISADSRQIYKHLDIGTAKTSPEELNAVPHHLIDALEIEEDYAAGRFAEDASYIINEIFARDRVPLIVGGAGLYIKALIDGLFSESSSDEDVRTALLERVESEGIESLYQEFQEIDPEYASEIHINDTKRIVRALEIYQVTRKKPSQHFKNEHEGLEHPYQMIALNRERKTLYDRVNRRVDQMIDNGLVQEVKNILEMGYTGKENSLRTVGYQEIIAYLNDEIPLGDAVRQIKTHSRHYAKRQLTWFRNQHDAIWFQFEDFASDKELLTAILEEIEG